METQYNLRIKAMIW